MPPHPHRRTGPLRPAIQRMRLLVFALVLGVLVAVLVTPRFESPAGHQAAAAVLSSPCPPPAAGASSSLPTALAVNPRGLPYPPLTARSVAVLDGPSGELLFGQNEHLRLPPASTTKIVTAMLVLQNSDLNAMIDIDLDARRMVGSSVMGLRPGMRLSVLDLLYGLMLPSGNDAAIVLAQHVAGSVPSFVDMMNQEVARLSLADTHFTNPHGLDAYGLYSSAYDLAMLGRAAMLDPRFAAIVGTARHDIPPAGMDLYNGNTMLESYPGADGVKIGWTDNADETFVASATRDGHRVFVVVMGSKNRFADATAALDWAFANYSWVHFTPAMVASLAIAEHLAPVGEGIYALTGICPGTAEETVQLRPPNHPGLAQAVAAAPPLAH